ncbi:UDP-N-acetylmuramoyl-tripeptide--D-alanyl-D-alanine ligase [Salinibius halmophilus]|uniref:UDP-N-acetylmuramoyl-tripeptide--D-alanyl-D- alanine ligase n=1 Tax=Salinibius halmophilus TaxID=1853216 RepID=UPI000E663CAC|nr:UDP-N-acetylmuramoyl-tripeptide--D-alanyl-D-alanine ligase [Salinibius halmophilus]
MIAYRLSELAQYLDGTLVGSDKTVTGFSTDSRQANIDDLFIALIGERFDAHDFCAASAAGACVVSRQLPIEQAQIVVADTQVALQQLGKFCRQQATKAKVVALTGSAGKTTTRELLAQMMQPLGEGVVTQGNLNNDIGVPLTLFRMQPTTEWAVIECGASRVGDIGRIAPLAMPQVTILLNALDAHIGKFGSLENIRTGKGEIIAAASQAVVLNLDDPAFAQWQARTPAATKLLTFSMHNPKAHAFASDIHCTARDTKLTVHIHGSTYSARIAVPGKHLVHNFLAALLAAVEHGVDASSAIALAESFEGFAGRMAFVELQDRLLIDDSYNASPASVYAAIDVLAAQNGYKVLALGDLAELGEQSERIHQEIGQYACGRVDELLTVGNISRFAQQQFDGRSKHYASNSDLTADLVSHLPVGSVLLVKGSRGAAMDQVADAARSLWSKS